MPYGPLPSPPSPLFLMSRQSVRPGSHRESIFTGGASEAYRADTVATCPPSLFDCVNALQDCFNEANEAHRILRNGTSDLPRMNKVLESEQIFLLVDEATVRRYKADLADEIEPQISELIERAEKGLKSWEIKQAALEAQVESAQRRPTHRMASGGTLPEQRRVQMLTKQRERLEQELKTLQAEIQQMEKAS